jgi:hypothetical protein
MEMTQGVILTDDAGKQHIFANKTDANYFLRRDKITAALKKVCGQRKELQDFLLEIDNSNAIKNIFKKYKNRTLVGKTKEKVFSNFEAAFEQLEEIVNNMEDENPPVDFLLQEKESIFYSFKFKRLKEDERKAAILKDLTELTDSAEAAQFILDNEEEIFQAWKAGIEVNPALQKAREARQKAAAAKEAEASEE